MDDRIKTHLLLPWAMAVVGATSVCACAHRNAATIDSIVIEPASSACLDTSNANEIPLSITHHSGGRVGFSTFDAAGPPYKLHAWTFAIEPAVPSSTDQWRVTLAHYYPPKNEVHIGPGDRVELLAITSQWPSPGYPGTVYVRVTDTARRTHLSRAMAVCAPSGPASDPGG